MKEPQFDRKLGVLKLSLKKKRWIQGSTLYISRYCLYKGIFILFILLWSLSLKFISPWRRLNTLKNSFRQEKLWAAVLIRILFFLYHGIYWNGFAKKKFVYVLNNNSAIIWEETQHPYTKSWFFPNVYV